MKKINADERRRRRRLCELLHTTKAKASTTKEQHATKPTQLQLLLWQVARIPFRGHTLDVERGSSGERRAPGSVSENLVLNATRLSDSTPPAPQHICMSYNRTAAFGESAVETASSSGQAAD